MVSDRLSTTTVIWTRAYASALFVQGLFSQIVVYIELVTLETGLRAAVAAALLLLLFARTGIRENGFYVVVCASVLQAIRWSTFSATLTAITFGLHAVWLLWWGGSKQRSYR